jgi:hypothetical protein
MRCMAFLAMCSIGVRRNGRRLLKHSTLNARFSLTFCTPLTHETFWWSSLGDVSVRPTFDMEQMPTIRVPYRSHCGFVYTFCGEISHPKLWLRLCITTPTSSPKNCTVGFYLLLRAFVECTVKVQSGYPISQNVERKPTQDIWILKTN